MKEWFNEIIEELEFWFEFLFRDKSCGVRFKIANLIMNDYLRNYLASINLNLNNALDIEERKIESRMLRRNIEKAKHTAEELFKI